MTTQNLMLCVLLVIGVALLVTDVVLFFRERWSYR